MGKEFNYSGIRLVLGIIRYKEITEFAELIDYISDEVEEYETEELMKTICDNAYVIIEYINSRRKQVTYED